MNGHELKRIMNDLPDHALDLPVYVYDNDNDWETVKQVVVGEITRNYRVPYQPGTDGFRHPAGEWKTDKVFALQVLP